MDVNIIGRLADQGLGIAPDCPDSLHSIDHFKGDDRWFVDDNPFAGHEHQSVCGPQIYCDLPRAEGIEGAEIHPRRGGVPWNAAAS